MTRPAIPYQRFFDSVLDQILLGHIDQAVGRLVGLLDGLALHGCDLGPARRALRSHALQQLLRALPMVRQAGRASALPAPASPTARQLHGAVGDIAVMQALQQRRTFGEGQLAQAIRAGNSICLCGRPSPAIDSRPGGRAQANITRIGADGARLSGLAATRPGAFDLILAPFALDSCQGPAVGQRLRDLHRLLAPGGTAIVSAVLPDHAGAGWARVCLNWQPFVHAEAALKASARAAGLTPRWFRDATGCLVWCIIEGPAAPHAGGHDHVGH